MNPRRLLIVEDEVVVRMHLETIVSELGWVISGLATCRDEAFAAAAEQVPDLALMDIRLEGEPDGIELARELRDRYGVHSIFVTAFADRETLRRVEAVGALGYLVKPFTRAEVGAALATALGQLDVLRRMRDRSRSLEAVLESSPDAMLVVDPNGRVLDLNARAVDLTGWPREEALDRPIDEVLRPGGGVAGARGALELAAEAANAEIELHDRAGHVTRIEVDVAPLYDAAGERSGTFVVLKSRPPGSMAENTASTGRPDWRGGAGIIPNPPRFHDLVGAAAVMRRVFSQIQELSLVDWSVLVEGETGTGKELVARAIHATSPRRRGPFVAVNCAGLTDSLLSSQLFGHRRGAFTGAVRDQPGLFETADGGTLFLDEICDMSPQLQKTLLRVLEERRITRLGDAQSRPVNVRVVAASQLELGNEVREGRFRADLLFRLRVARVQLPPLRERRADVPLLARWFLARSRKASGKSVVSFSPDALQLLVEHDWPGNVRELRHAIDYAVLASRGRCIELDDLPVEILAVGQPGPAPNTRSAPTRGTSPHDAAAAWSRERPSPKRVLEALERAGGNRTRAARLAGISRATLYRRLAELESAAPEAPKAPAPE